MIHNARRAVYDALFAVVVNATVWKNTDSLLLVKYSQLSISHPFWWVLVLQPQFWTLLYPSWLLWRLPLEWVQCRLLLCLLVFALTYYMDSRGTCKGVSRLQSREVHYNINLFITTSLIEPEMRTNCVLILTDFMFSDCSKFKRKLCMHNTKYAYIYLCRYVPTYVQYKVCLHNYVHARKLLLATVLNLNQLT